jgi:hypothetical protein
MLNELVGPSSKPRKPLSKKKDGLKRGQTVSSLSFFLLFLYPRQLKKGLLGTSAHSNDDCHAGSEANCSSTLACLIHES